MVMVYPVGISPEHQNNKSLIINPFLSLARYASHSGDIAFKENQREMGFPLTNGGSSKPFAFAVDCFEWF